MKIHYLLSIVLVITSYSSFSQSHQFPDSLASWSETQIVYGGPGDPWIYSVGKLEIDGDTLIFGVNYKKLSWYAYCDSISQSTIGYFRVDSLKVYFRDELSVAIPPLVNLPYVNYMFNDSGEVLLYDFGIQPGDTFRFESTVLDSVSSIDSILLNGSYHKRYNFYNMYTNGNLDPYYWIEGVGSTYGFFPAYYVFENELFFNCFSTYNDTISFGGSCPCSPVSISEITPTFNKIRIMPNPCINSTVISFPFSKSHIISIYNLVGKKVKEITFHGDEYQLDLSKLNKGIYILRTEDDYFEKVVVQ